MKEAWHVSCCDDRRFVAGDEKTLMACLEMLYIAIKSETGIRSEEENKASARKLELLNTLAVELVGVTPATFETFS